LVMIYNLKPPQVACAQYAIARLGLPVILEYEDGAFISDGAAIRRNGSLLSKFYLSTAQRLIENVSGCIAVSPYLLAQTPARVPKLLLRGVVNRHLTDRKEDINGSKLNRVIFSGTHERSQGLEQLVRAWRVLGLPDWELHIAGQGPLTDTLRKLAGDR